MLTSVCLDIYIYSILRMRTVTLDILNNRALDLLKDLELLKLFV